MALDHTTYFLITILVTAVGQSKADDEVETASSEGAENVQFVLSARNLPDTDKISFMPSDVTDAYVEIQYFRSNRLAGSKVGNTTIIDNNLSPQWPIVFEIKFVPGDKQRITFIIMDKDTITKDDEIGNVEVSLMDIAHADGNELIKKINGKDGPSGDLIINTMINRQITDNTVLRLRKYHEKPENFKNRLELID